MIDPQEFGRLQAQVEALLKADAERAKLLEEVHAFMMAAQGGWKMLIGIVTAAATIGASLWELFNHIKHWFGAAS